MLEKDYKFYIAAENSLCSDYSSEKLQNALLFHTVPVVYGAADYANLAPKNSYIDVRNYTSRTVDYKNHGQQFHAQYFKMFLFCL